MQDSMLGSLRHKIASRFNAPHKPTDLSIIKQKNLNWIARPYHEWTLSPRDFIADWLSHLALAIYMFVVVKFRALVQANDLADNPIQWHIYASSELKYCHILFETFWIRASQLNDSYIERHRNLKHVTLLVDSELNPRFIDCIFHFTLRIMKYYGRSFYIQW